MARRQVWHMFGQHAFFQDTKSLQRTFSQLSDMMGQLSELVEAYKPGTERETGVVFRNSMDAFRSEFDIKLWALSLTVRGKSPVVHFNFAENERANQS